MIRIAAKTRAAAVTDELARLILRGELAPGTRLRQDELAARFGVSSTPVREALATLARRGLARYDTHLGAVVHTPTRDDVIENFEIRLALEPLATRLAAGRLDAAELAVLDGLVEQLDDAVTDAVAGDGTSYQELDRELHGRIFLAAGRPRLAEMIESLRDAAVAYSHLHPPAGLDESVLRRLHTQHPALVAALRAGNGETAEALAREHVWLTAEGAGVADR